METGWLQVIEYENSIKIRDQLGNFIIVPKSEAVDVALNLLDIISKREAEGHVH